MAGGKHFKPLCKRLRQLGYEDTGERVAGGNMWVFAGPSGDRVRVEPGLSENTARQMLRELERKHGVAKKAPKRDANAAKERRAIERQQLRDESERLERARQQIIDRRAALLDGAGSHLTNAEIRDLEHRVLEIERQQREIEALMTERPSLNDRVKHRSGER